MPRCKPALCSCLEGFTTLTMRTVGTDDGQAAVHVNAKVELVEERRPVRVVEVHVVKAQHGRVDWVRIRKPVGARLSITCCLARQAARMWGSAAVK